MAVPAALHPQAVCGMNRGFRRAAEHRIRKALVGYFRRSLPLLLLRIRHSAHTVSAYRRGFRHNRAEEKQILFSADFREIPYRGFYRNSCCR